MKPMITMLCAGALACLAGTIQAKESSYRQATNADSADTFQQVVTWVHDEMKAGGRYASLDPADRVALDAKLAVAAPPRTTPPLPCGERAGERGRAGGPVDAKRAPIIPPASPAPSPQSSPRRGEEANA